MFIVQCFLLFSEQVVLEFFDKVLFCGFIQKLCECKIVWIDEVGKFDYDSVLDDMVCDVWVILVCEVCYFILKIILGGYDDCYELDWDDDKVMCIGFVVEVMLLDVLLVDLYVCYVEVVYCVYVYELVELVVLVELDILCDE